MTTPAPDISSLLDQLRTQLLEVVEERDDLRLRLTSIQERIKTKLAWHRDGVGPDVPVLQERYDKLIKERDELHVERRQLLRLLRVAVSPTQCYCGVLKNRKCWQCGARELINAADQKERSE